LKLSTEQPAALGLCSNFGNYQSPIKTIFVKAHY